MLVFLILQSIYRKLSSIAIIPSFTILYSVIYTTYYWSIHGIKLCRQKECRVGSWVDAQVWVIFIYKYIMRNDKARNLAKITNEMLKDPLQSERKLAKKLWVWKTTVNKRIKEISKVDKSEQVNRIIEADIEIVEIATKILKDRLKLAEESPESMSTRDVIASADVSAKRYSLFKWDVTDKDRWLKQSIEIKIV